MQAVRYLLIALCLAAAAAHAEVRIVKPTDGSSVPLLRDGHKAYFGLPRKERLAKMDDVEERKRLFFVGNRQQTLELVWTGSVGRVTLEIAPEGGKREVFVFTNGETCARITNLELAKRYVWRVSCDGGSAEASFTTEDLPPRMLTAGGVGNFRDLGGWKTTDGRRVRQNRIFRSAGLRSSAKVSSKSMFSRKLAAGDQRVTAAGIATLRDEFAIRTDLELRSDRESAAMDDTVLGEGVAWKRIPFVAYEFIDIMSSGKEQFAELFSIFTKEENYPVLMHCSGGRDRTGTVAFLLNGVLGVPEEDLRRDWEASIFSDPSVAFAPSRLERLTDYISKLSGATFRDRVESYFRSCGISDGEIAAFRGLMLAR